MKASAQSIVCPEPDSKRTILDRVRKTGLAGDLMDRIDLQVKRRHRRRRTALRTVAAAVLLTALLGYGWLAHTSTVLTVPDQRKTLDFADGSRAELNAQTRIRTDFSFHRRIVHLDQGEAFFSVAKDTSRPFLVETPAGTVQVLGTRFNVRVGEEGSAEVTLLEGRVAFSTRSAAPVGLLPGQQVESGNPVPRLLSQTELDAVTAWRSGRLVLDGLTLGEAAARFASYNGRRIEVDPSVASLHLGGTCALDDLPHFLEVLAATKTVQALPSGDGGYRIASP